MGVIYLHFSKLIIKIFTLLNAVLLTGAQKIFLFSSTSKHVNVSQLSDFEKSAHVTVSLLPHGK